MKDPGSILITGASSGIGAALAEAYAAPSIHLALCGRDAGRLAAVAQRCRGNGATVAEACIDVSDAAAVADWIATAEAAAPLDLVIANAGIQGGLWRGGAGEAQAWPDRGMEGNFNRACTTLLPILPTIWRRR